MKTTTNSNTHMASVIKAIRKGYRVTTKQLASEIGTTAETLRNYERGEQVECSLIIEKAAMLFFQLIKERGYHSKEIGEVWVDSGQIVTVDPGYLDDWVAGEYEPEMTEPVNSYDEVCKTTSNGRKLGQVLQSKAFAFSTGTAGDGIYPVRGVFDINGDLSKIVIEID